MYELFVCVEKERWLAEREET